MTIGHGTYRSPIFVLALIHLGAWKVNSEKFAQQKFSEVRIAPVLYGSMSYVEYRRSLAFLHKSQIMPLGCIMVPHRRRL